MNFYKSEQTLIRILDIINSNQKGAYLRFGDGDVNLANGDSDMLQVVGPLLSEEMKEAFSINGLNILKALPIHCNEYLGVEPGMFPGNHETNLSLANNIIERVKPLWGEEITDIYSPVALHYLSVSNIDFTISFLKNIGKKANIFIGNENIPIDILKLFMSDNFHFIKTPVSNSYNKINHIEEEFNNIIDNNNYSVIITSMGCSGRVMQKRIYKKGVNAFLFDFGSLMDALCGWNTRAWIELTKFDNNIFINKMKEQ